LVTGLPLVSVIIPTYHDWSRLQLCLAAVAEQTYPSEQLEVIVVNNDPADSPSDLEFPGNWFLLSEPKKGSYAARNRGIFAARGEIVAFTDSDCIPYPDWIEQAVNALQAGANRVAGRVELFFQSSKLTAAEVYEKAFAFDQEKNARTGGSITANMITWRKNFEKIGFFNDGLQSGGDNEWGWRAQAKGINIVYAPSVVVRHPARHSLQELLKKEKRVVGGVVNIKSIGPIHGRLLGYFDDFIPPVKPFFKLISRKDLPLSEKIVATFILATLRLYRIFQRMRFSSHRGSK